MRIDLLKYDRRGRAAARRPHRARLAAVLGATVYLLATAVPELRLVVHDHAGGDRVHSHAETAAHSHAAAAPRQSGAGVHVHRGDAHHAHHHHDHHRDGDRLRHDRHHDHHHPHDHGKDDPGEGEPSVGPSAGAVLRVGSADRAHWHDEAPHGLATVELPLLLISLAAKAASPSIIASAAPREAIRATRARGPPFLRSALDISEI